MDRHPLICGSQVVHSLQLLTSTAFLPQLVLLVPHFPCLLALGSPDNVLATCLELLFACDSRSCFCTFLSSSATSHINGPAGMDYYARPNPQLRYGGSGKLNQDSFICSIPSSRPWHSSGSWSLTCNLSSQIRPTGVWDPSVTRAKCGSLTGTRSSVSSVAALMAECTRH